MGHSFSSVQGVLVKIQVSRHGPLCRSVCASLARNIEKDLLRMDNHRGRLGQQERWLKMIWSGTLFAPKVGTDDLVFLPRWEGNSSFCDLEISLS